MITTTKNPSTDINRLPFVESTRKNMIPNKKHQFGVVSSVNSLSTIWICIHIYIYICYLSPPLPGKSSIFCGLWWLYIYIHVYGIHQKTTNVSWAEVESRILSKDNPAVFLKHMEVGCTRHGHFESTRIWYFPNKVPIGSMYGRFTYVTYIWLILW